jgi:hypothetical protein
MSPPFSRWYGEIEPFAGVVVEAAAARAFVQRADRVRRERAEAHRRDVEHAGRIRLRALRPADVDAEVVAVDLGWCHRMVDPLVLRGVDIELGAERALVEHVLRALIGNRTLHVRERHLFVVGFDDILAQHRPKVFEERPQMRRYRKVTAQRVPRRGDVDDAEDAEHAADCRNPAPEHAVPRQRRGNDECEQAQGERQEALRQNFVHDLGSRRSA